MLQDDILHICIYCLFLRLLLHLFCLCLGLRGLCILLSTCENLCFVRWFRRGYLIVLWIFGWLWFLIPWGWSGSFWGFLPLDDWLWAHHILWILGIGLLPISSWLFRLLISWLKRGSLLISSCCGSLNLHCWRFINPRHNLWILLDPNSRFGLNRSTNSDRLNDTWLNDWFDCPDASHLG